MQSFIITGGTLQERKHYVTQRVKAFSISPFDVIDITAETLSIGIGDIRDLERRLMVKPQGLGEYALCVIYDAEKLTHQAQNALLKTLEEPPKHALIFLLTENAGPLLPTIFSRCQVVDMGQSRPYSKEELSDTLEIIQKLRSTSVGNKLVLLDQVAKNREEAAGFIDRALYALHELLFTDIISSRELTTLIRMVLVARDRLSSNANFRPVLDMIFLPLP